MISLVGPVCLPETRYAFCRLRLQAVSHRLEAWVPSLSLCSTPFGSWSGHAPRCTWKSSRSATSLASSIDPAADAFGSRRPTGFWAWLSCAWRGWRRPFTSSSRRRSSAGTGALSSVLGLEESRERTGRPGVPPDVRALIRELSTANPLWGAPRIHGELQKLGISVGQSTVAKYMRRHPRPPSPTWRSFLTNHASQIMAADLFIVPTVTFRLLFVLVILAHERRRIVHVAVTEHPTAAWTARQLRNAFPDDEAPGYLVHDRDAVFADVATTIAGMNIHAVRTAPRSPWRTPTSRASSGPSDVSASITSSL